MRFTRESLSGTTQAGLCPNCIKRLAREEAEALAGWSVKRIAVCMALIGVIAVVVGLVNHHSRSDMLAFLGGGMLVILSIILFIASSLIMPGALRKTPWKLLGRGPDTSQIIQGCRLYVPVGDNYYRNLSKFKRVNCWLSDQMADKLFREVIQSGTWKTIPEAPVSDAPEQKPPADV